MAPIQQIGQRLVKTFANNRTVITETLGKGQTYTKVLDNEGKVLFERLKVIKDAVKVGNKKVIHTDRVVRNYDKNVTKISTDRVVSAEGKFLGLRDMSNRDTASGVAKQIEVARADGTRNYFRTWIRENGTRSSEARIATITQVDRQCGDRWAKMAGSDRRDRNFNAKGLQRPDNMDHAMIPDGSMKEMREAMQAKYPNLPYTNWPGMSSLDDRVANPASNLFDLLG